MKKSWSIATIVTSIYLLITLVIYVYSVTCSGFLCGIGALLPVFPIAQLVSNFDKNYTWTNSDSFLFNSLFGYWLLVIMHALIIYLIFSLISKFIVKK